MRANLVYDLMVMPSENIHNLQLNHFYNDDIFDLILNMHHKHIDHE